MSGRKCVRCGESLEGYFPNTLWCDACEDLYPGGYDADENIVIVDGEPVDAGDMFDDQTESLADCLADIGGGLSTSPWCPS